jgi:hypothetical protein
MKRISEARAGFGLTGLAKLFLASHVQKRD